MLLMNGRAVANPHRACVSSGLAAAVRKRDELLQRTADMKTQVIDDQGDYYDDNNRWLSEDQREKARRKREIDQQREAIQDSRGARPMMLNLELGGAAGAQVSLRTAELSDLGLEYEEDYRQVSNSAAAGYSSSSAAGAGRPGAGVTPAPG